LGAVDDRVEVHERVVSRRVLVADLRLLRSVDRPDARVEARAAHVLHVRLPTKAARVELVGDGGDGLRVHAALPYCLTFGCDAGTDEVRVRLAITLGLHVRSLTTDLRDVVRQAVVRDTEVLREQLPARSQRAVQILRR